MSERGRFFPESGTASTLAKGIQFETVAEDNVHADDDGGPPSGQRFECPAQSSAKRASLVNRTAHEDNSANRRARTSVERVPTVSASVGKRIPIGLTGDMASSKVARRRQGSLGPLPKDSPPPPAVNGAASPSQSLDNLEMIKTIGESIIINGIPDKDLWESPGIFQENLLQAPFTGISRLSECQSDACLRRFR